MPALPPDVFENIFLFLTTANDVIALASTCRDARAAYQSLPPWMPHFLSRDKRRVNLSRRVVFQPLQRSLRVLLTSCCELCGKGHAKGSNSTFRIYAHDKCINKRLKCATTYKDKAVIMLAIEMRLPCEFRLHPHNKGEETLYFWEKPVEGIIEPCETLEGLAQMTREEAMEAHATLTAQRKRYDDVLEERRIKTPRPLVGAKQITWTGKKLHNCRHIDAALRAEGLPSIVDVWWTIPNTCNDHLTHFLKGSAKSSNPAEIAEVVRIVKHNYISTHGMHLAMAESLEKSRAEAREKREAMWARAMKRYGELMSKKK